MLVYPGVAHGEGLGHVQRLGTVLFVEGTGRDTLHSGVPTVGDADEVPGRVAIQRVDAHHVSGPGNRPFVLWLVAACDGDTKYYGTVGDFVEVLGRDLFY